MQVGFFLVTLSSALAYFVAWEWRLLIYPLLTVATYMNMPGRLIWAMYAGQIIFYAGLVLTGASTNHSGLFVDGLVLTLWLSFLTFMSFKEKSAKKTLHQMVANFNKESKVLSVRSDILTSELNLIEKKNAHRSELIQKRGENIRSLMELFYTSFKPHTLALYLYDPLSDKFDLKEFLTKSGLTLLNTVELEGIFLAATKERDLMVLSSNHHVRSACYYRKPAGIKSLICIPLYTNHFLHGVLLIDDISARSVSEDDKKMLQTLGRKILAAMEESELLQGYFNLKEELSAFYDASSALNRCFRVSDVLETLLTSARKIIEYDHAAIVLYDSKTNTGKVALEMGREKMGWEEETFSCAQDKGLISWVVNNRMPLSYNDFRARNSETPIFHKKWKIPNVFDSVLILPLFVSEESLGAVVFLAESKNIFSKSVRKLLEVISMQASISMKNATMVRDLEKLATTDGLTGLFNHRTFQERLTQEFSRFERHPYPFSLLLIDIDFFKKFNDEHGHPVGDFVLQKVGEVLVQTLRKVDLVARYGGEEFAVILFNTDPQSAFKMAQRIVETVRAKIFEHQSLKLSVTVSVGVASTPKDAKVREELIEKADQALYESKKRGRNRATLFQTSFGKVEKVPVFESIKSRVPVQTN